MSDELEKKVDQLVTDLTEVKIALKGYNGTQGLIPAFTKHCEANECFQRDYYKFKRTVLMIFFFLLGSGVLGVGGVKIAEVLAKGG